MTGIPDWFALAECRRRGLPVALFFPGYKQEPDPAAVAACRACPVGGPDGPCEAERGDDSGYRAGSMQVAYTRPKTCEECGGEFRAAGGAYRLCVACSGRRRGAA